MSRILVVDDEPDILFTLRIALELAGHEILEAADGEQALELAEEIPDAIILDLRLPDMDGIEVLRQLKMNKRHKTIPVLCLSAHSDSATKQRALDAGAIAYMNKPFELGALRTAVQDILDARGESGLMTA